MAKTIAPFRDSQAHSWLFGPRTDVPSEPLSHRPCVYPMLPISLDFPFLIAPSEFSNVYFKQSAQLKSLPGCHTKNH